MQPGQKKYLNMGKGLADKQWRQPEGKHVTSEQYVYYNMGLTWQTRLWIDDMFMITAVQSQAYLAMGDIWMAVGMNQLFRLLPKDNPTRLRILEGYQKMMVSLLKYQTDHGMWRQVIDDPDSQPETSCTVVFAFAYISGVKNGGQMEAVYGPATRKAWRLC